MGIAPILPCAEPLAKKQDWPIHGRGFVAKIGTPVEGVDLTLFITGADCIYLQISVNTDSLLQLSLPSTSSAGYLITHTGIL